MQFTNVLVLLAATAAYAMPGGYGIPSDGNDHVDNSRTNEENTSVAQAIDNSKDIQCGNGLSMSCCNTGGGDANVLPILGSLCSLNVPAAAAVGLGGDVCGSQTPMCCSTDQAGTINIGSPCIPLPNVA